MPLIIHALAVQGVCNGRGQSLYPRVTQLLETEHVKTSTHLLESSSRRRRTRDKPELNVSNSRHTGCSLGNKFRRKTPGSNPALPFITPPGSELVGFGFSW